MQKNKGTSFRRGGSTVSAARYKIMTFKHIGEKTASTFYPLENYEILSKGGKIKHQASNLYKITVEVQTHAVLFIQLISSSCVQFQHASAEKRGKKRGKIPMIDSQGNATRKDRQIRERERERSQVILYLHVSVYSLIRSVKLQIKSPSTL